MLILTGALLGWVASIVTRIEEPRGILAFIGVGMLASLAGGLTTNSGGLLGSLSLVALGIAAASAVALLCVYWFVFVRRVNDTGG
ncbi:MAG: hypothetical protein AAGK02_07460 [Pseudomonadota bacterium]